MGSCGNSNQRLLPRLTWRACRTRATDLLPCVCLHGPPVLTRPSPPHHLTRTRAQGMADYKGTVLHARDFNSLEPLKVGASRRACACVYMWVWVWVWVWVWMGGWGVAVSAKTF